MTSSGVRARSSAARAPSPGARTPGAVRAGVLLLGLLLPLLPLAPAGAGAQPVHRRSPNLTGTWVASPLHLHFQFAHRFRVVGGEADVTDIFGDGKIVNYPTFDIGLGLFPDAMAGFRYSSNSVVAGQVNEWQPYLKYALLSGSGDGDLSLAATAAWNGANQSLDGELTARTRWGPVFLLGAVRGFTDAFDLPPGAEDEALALAGGAGIRLNRYVTLAGDVADVVAGATVPGADGGSDLPAAWSAGLQIAIPATPHTLSLQATNVYSGTLEGASTGDGDAVFWGFEFTVPFTGFARWGELFGEEDERSEPAPRTRERAPAAGNEVVVIEISDLSFGPAEVRVPAGATLRWINRDPVAHTSTSDDGVWDSSLLDPGESWSRTFHEPGRYAYHCTPHPFMEGVVIVTERRQP